MIKFFINLDTDIERKERFLELNKKYDFIRWEATGRDDVSEELDQKMISMYNYPASFDENGMSSTIHKKSKRANRYYEWVNY